MRERFRHLSGLWLNAGFNDQSKDLVEKVLRLSVEGMSQPTKPR